MFRSLLIATSLRDKSDAIAARVALLPLAPAARVNMLHVVPRWLGRRTKAADAHAHEALEVAATKVAGHLPRDATVERAVVEGAAATAIAGHARDTGADLIVMGRGVHRPICNALIGSLAERVIQDAELPVLVSGPFARAPYRRPLLALDVDDAASDVLAVVFRIVAPACSRISVLHVYDIPFGGLTRSGLSPDEVRAWQESYHQAALQEIAPVLAAAIAKARAQEPKRAADVFNPWHLYVRYGSPRALTEQLAKEMGADLLLLGAPGHSRMARTLLGTLAGDLLRDVGCDVLIVPPRRSARSATTPAARRFGLDLAVANGRA